MSNTITSGFNSCSHFGFSGSDLTATGVSEWCDVQDLEQQNKLILKQVGMDSARFRAWKTRFWKLGKTFNTTLYSSLAKKSVWEFEPSSKCRNWCFGLKTLVPKARHVTRVLMKTCYSLGKVLPVAKLSQMPGCSGQAGTTRNTNLKMIVIVLFFSPEVL